MDNRTAITPVAGIMQRVPSHRRRTQWASWLLVVPGLAGAAGCATEAVDPVARPTFSAASRPEGAARARRDRALRVLRQWDDARAVALAGGHRRALVRLYAPRSRLARADSRLLAHYASRGLQLTAVQHQTVSVDVTVSRPRVVELTVVERLAVVRVTDRHGQERPLAASQFARHLLRFERLGGVWRLRSARDV